MASVKKKVRTLASAPVVPASRSFSFLTCPEFSAHLGPGADRGGCNLTCLRLISNGLDDFYNIQSYAAMMSEF